MIVCWKKRSSLGVTADGLNEESLAPVDLKFVSAEILSLNIRRNLQPVTSLPDPLGATESGASCVHVTAQCGDSNERHLIELIIDGHLFRSVTMVQSSFLL